ncbi:hypothetical protein KAS08_02090 [Candidatus Pacearchaeota archaeon]|nr:hypothetical protein [Candidatus Pacearchaeota archaeon]
MVMKKIFDGVFDAEVHANFLKFGRGEYKNKYMLEGKKQAKKWAIKASAEYANTLVRKSLELISGQVAVKGVIVSTLDLKDELPFPIEKVKNFQGVKKNVINTEIEPSVIINLMDKYPKVFFALSFSGPGFTLKIKPKAPASGKKGKDKDEGPAVDFCSLKTESKEVLKEFFFGDEDFKIIAVTHTINVTDIVYPKNMSELKPAEVREQAKRKGIITRIVKKDDKETSSTTEFTA